jgi:hypothetical protein
VAPEIVGALVKTAVFLIAVVLLEKRLAVPFGFVADTPSSTKRLRLEDVSCTVLCVAPLIALQLPGSAVELAAIEEVH